MEPITAVWLIGLLLAGVLSFVGWLIRDRFKKLEEVDGRLIKVEVKLDVLGDINTTLHALRTDVELIKQRLEKQ
jgi:hypothetical protein